ncbi:MAG: NADH-quinone oxidoreductase subunit J, partial [Acidimicrobiia bacterium]
GSVLVAGYLWLSGVFTWSVVGEGTEPVNGSVEATGRLLFEGWLLPFEVTSLLLIIASVGAVGLALFRPRRREGAE